VATYRRSIFALCVFASASALPSCGDGGKDLSPKSPLIAWRYTSDFPWSGGPAKIQQYDARIENGGVLVLEAVRHASPEATAFRLLRLSGTGTVLAKKVVSKRRGFSVGFPLGLGGSEPRCHLALYDSRMSAEGGSRASVLSVDRATLAATEGPAAKIGGFPNAAFRSKDGRTIFAGEDDARLWLAALSPVGELLWLYF
jgi:hypothetical protein